LASGLFRLLGEPVGLPEMVLGRSVVGTTLGVEAKEAQSCAAAAVERRTPVGASEARVP
jgi:hypothetical protein